MNTIKIGELEKEGYKGIDVSLEISLFEYGMCWREKDGELGVIFGTHIDENGNFVKFFSGRLPLDVDLWEEYSWIDEDDRDAFLDEQGIDLEDFNKQPLGKRVFDLVNYFGAENFFGIYQAGFKIEP